MKLTALKELVFIVMLKMYSFYVGFWPYS